MTRICAVSDLHGHLPDVPQCDLFIIAGDVCPLDNHSCEYQWTWLNLDFKFWLKKNNLCGKTIVVFGNHDFIGQKKRLGCYDIPYCVYLEDDGTSAFFDLKVYGSPWQPVFFDWAFNLPEHELAMKWALIPEGLDILVLHGPPHGTGDLVNGRHAGSITLDERLRSMKNPPKLIFCGHIHAGRGLYQYANGSLLANVSYLNEGYKPYCDELPLFDVETNDDKVVSVECLQGYGEKLKVNFNDSCNI